MDSTDDEDEEEEEVEQREEVLEEEQLDFEEMEIEFAVNEEIEASVADQETGEKMSDENEQEESQREGMDEENESESEAIVDEEKGKGESGSESDSDSDGDSAMEEERNESQVENEYLKINADLSFLAQNVTFASVVNVTVVSVSPPSPLLQEIRPRPVLHPEVVRNKLTRSLSIHSNMNKMVPSHKRRTSTPGILSSKEVLFDRDDDLFNRRAPSPIQPIHILHGDDENKTRIIQEFVEAKVDFVHLTQINGHMVTSIKVKANQILFVFRATPIAYNVDSIPIDQCILLKLQKNMQSSNFDDKDLFVLRCDPSKCVDKNNNIHRLHNSTKPEDRNTT